MKKLFYVTKAVILLLLCVFVTGKVSAQQKKMLTPGDYGLWASSLKIKNSEVSGDGNWLAYKIGNDSIDSVRVKNIKTGIQYNFSTNRASNDFADYYNNMSFHFSEDNNWYAFIAADSLKILNLSTGKVQILAGMKDFVFIGRGQYLLSSSKDSSEQTLWLRDLKTQSVKTIKHVKEYQLNSDKSAMAVITGNKVATEVQIVSIERGLSIDVVCSTKEGDLKSLVWNKPGNSVAFYETEKTGKEATAQKIYVCNYAKGNTTVKTLNPKIMPEFPKNYQFQLSRKLHLSDDGQRLFFYLTKEKDVTNPARIAATEPKSNVEIWFPTDGIVPPSKQPRPITDFWYTWQVGTANVQPVNDKEHPYVILTAKQNKVLLFNSTSSRYLPQYEYVKTYTDLFIKDLVTGNKKILLSKVQNQPNSFLISPKGKYITYYKDKQWWVYDINKDTHKCITEGTGVIFENIQDEDAGIKTPYGHIGWFEDDSQLILYDQYDIWVMSPDGVKRKKITNGRATNTRLRLYDDGIGISMPGEASSWLYSKSYDSKRGVLIESLDNSNLDKGYWYWNEGSGLKQMVQKDKKLILSSRVAYNKPFLFTESDFDSPPRLMLYQPSGKEQLIYQTDPHQKQFHWGKSELIKYRTPDGQELKGALFYPANYDPAKKYPMVVEVYEKRAKEVHDYIRPSLSNDASTDDLNPTTYTAEGYFVLFPDITYKINDPGISAAGCVKAVVKSVIDKNLVDKDRIGLMGHSFGGYETTFIITQTNLFKAAIAGAAITNLPDWYLSMSESFGSNLNRVEEGQHRMQSMFYGEEFRRNSPMHNIQHINTPLLLWTGDKDNNVDWTQSRKFHIGLWRLGKPSTLLVYLGEDHCLTQPANLKDLATREKNWFDYYLKGEKPADWIVKGLPQVDLTK
jgi:dipeptidyl aminopeptidase/acylaminoacyl peptidase